MKNVRQLRPDAPGGLHRPGLHLLAVGLTLSAVAALPGQASGQQDSVTIVPGERYEAGSLHRAVLGTGYRDLWTTPIRVPVLLPDTFATGLTPSELGGGAQTISLRFVDQEGREWTFRSVDKDQAGGLHPDLRGTLVSRIAQDQVSTKHPSSAMVVAPILEAAGILHATPRLAVMADAPSLGEYREQFAGMLGMIEERPDEAADAGPFSIYERVIGTERLLERLAEGAEDRVDAEAYLRARLVDLMIGDWDRHPDQWRWAQVDSAGIRWWHPIPRDRDNAFSNVDGLMGVIGGALRSNVFAYTAEYPALYGMMHNAQVLDRRILPEVPRERWIGIAREIQAAVTDEVLQRATAQMPDAWEALNRSELLGILQARRDALAEAAAAFHTLQMSAPDVHATDLEDEVVVRRLGDGSVQVELAQGDWGTYRTATFDPEFTREVRVYLEDGDDRAVVEGDGPSALKIRIIGGDGDDAYSDATGGSELQLFDGEGDNDFSGALGAHVDRSDYEVPEVESFVENNAPAPRDWGADQTMFAPTAMWISQEGPVIGGGPVWTRYGFRRIPYARQTRLTALWAPLQTRFGVIGEYSATWTGDRGRTDLRAEATQLPVSHFYGYGNETADPSEDADFGVWSNQFHGRIDLHRFRGKNVDVFAGISGTHVMPDLPDAFPASLITAGTDDFSVAGVHLGTELDLRDSETFPTRGLHLRGEASGYPWTRGDATERFGTATAAVAGYIPVPIPLESVIALRVGGERLWGEGPLQYAANIGGGSTIRGFAQNRYSGDTAAWGSAEVRTRLFHANFGIARGELGVIGLYDAGRVWLSGEDSEVWHQAPGGGLWFATVDRKLTAHVVYAHGERGSLSASIGMPF